MISQWQSGKRRSHETAVCASGNENKLPTSEWSGACTQEIRWLNPIICGASRPPSLMTSRYSASRCLWPHLSRSLAQDLQAPYFPLLPRPRLMANEAVMDDPAGCWPTGAATALANSTFYCHPLRWSWNRAAQQIAPCAVSPALENGLS